MRNLMICFNQEGEFLREIHEERNYYLSEAETIIRDIRQRLVQEKRVISPKQFECWLDGQKIIVSHVFFEKGESLEKQLESTMLNYESWEESIRYKYTNKLRDYAEHERQLFLNKEFEAFSIRFDQILGNKKMEPFPLLFDVSTLKKLFDAVYASTQTGFYAELEGIIEIVKKSVQPIMRHIVIEREQEILKNPQLKGTDDYILKNYVDEWLTNEDNFRKFTQYVSACYQSISYERIDAICTRFKPYQVLEKTLFQSFASHDGFKKAIGIHSKMHQEFVDKYDTILFNGFVIKDDAMLESLVLNPIIEKVKNDLIFIDKKSNELNQEVRENEPTESVSIQ